MNICFILNGRVKNNKSIPKRLNQLLGKAGQVSTTFHFTTEKLHAQSIAAAAHGYDIVVSCGGDGTNNEVLNGLMQLEPIKRPAFSFLPTGSANDFARNFETRNLNSIVKTWLSGNGGQFVDVIQITHNQQSHYALNMVTCGIGAEIANTVNKRKFAIPAGINYYTAILHWLLRYAAPTIEVNGLGAQFIMPAFLIAVGNGKFAGNGLGLNPQSTLSDGLLGITIIGNVGVLDFLKYQASLKKAEIIPDKRLIYNTTKQVELKVLKGQMAVETDGETLAILQTGDAVSMHVLPNELKCY